MRCGGSNRCAHSCEYKVLATGLKPSWLTLIDWLSLLIGYPPWGEGILGDYACGGPKMVKYLGMGAREPSSTFFVIYLYTWPPLQLGPVDFWTTLEGN